MNLNTHMHVPVSFRLYECRHGCLYIHEQHVHIHIYIFIHIYIYIYTYVLLRMHTSSRCGDIPAVMREYFATGINRQCARALQHRRHRESHPDPFTLSRPHTRQTSRLDIAYQSAGDAMPVVSFAFTEPSPWSFIFDVKCFTWKIYIEGGDKPTHPPTHLHVCI